MEEGNPASYSWAVQDFRRARHRAGLKALVARLRGDSSQLLSYDDVREKLGARESPRRELQEIPLDAIVGSVGRYRDFTRDFLPRRDSDAGRWASVKVAMTGLVGVPPIEAYQLGDVYFVLDGNHRVSVAGEMGASHIQGYARKVQTRVPIEPDTQPDDLISKAEYVGFLERTKLDKVRPEAKLAITEVGRYRILEDQIEACRRGVSSENVETDTQEQAVATWYDEAYLPVVKLIRERRMLRGYPGRTEADLYVWISQHHAALEEALGWEIKPQVAASELAAQAEDRGLLRVGRLVHRKSSPPERWRVGVFEGFGFPLDVLVALSGELESWSALEQAQVIARREGARLLGLHVVESEAMLESEHALAVKAEYQSRCGGEAISCQLAIDAGDAAEKISERARWTDLVVVHLAHPPRGGPSEKSGSGFRTLIRKCPRPILAVPGEASPLGRALLAYDGSTKSVEALYLATYLAGRWQTPLTVVTVTNGDRVTEHTLEEAGQYIAGRGVQPTLEAVSGDAVSGILEVVEETGSDLLLMGGYGHSQVSEAVLGSTVDAVLRQSRIPLLICR